jgi:hypothetical protein
VDNIATFMFHHGLVTHAAAGAGRIALPNGVVSGRGDGLVAVVDKLSNAISGNLPCIVQQPTVENVWALLTDVMAPLGSRFDNTISEVAVVAVIEGILMNKTPVVTVRVEEEQSQKRRRDMYLKYENAIVLLEFKRIRPAGSQFVPTYPSVDKPPSRWPTERDTQQKEAALMWTATEPTKLVNRASKTSRKAPWEATVPELQEKAATHSPRLHSHPLDVEHRTTQRFHRVIKRCFRRIHQVITDAGVRDIPIMLVDLFTTLSQLRRLAAGRVVVATFVCWLTCAPQHDRKRPQKQ